MDSLCTLHTAHFTLYTAHETMTDWISLINFAGTTSAFMLMLIGLIFSSFNRIMDRWNRSFFISMYSVMLLYIASDLTAQLSSHYILSKVSLFLESFFSSLLMPMLTCYMLSLLGKEWRKSPVFYHVICLCLIYFVILFITQFTTLIYYYTPDNVYHRGPLYPLLLIPAVLIMLINLSFLIRNKDNLPQKRFVALLIYFLFPMTAMVLQIFFYGLYLIIFATALSAMFMLWFNVWDMMDHYMLQQQEIARQRSSIMVLEMRPHFIFNTMTSIYYLCEQDAAKAQQVILDFTSYLRRNFDAIIKEKTIPFTNELEHTKAYLAVEQVRFDNKLFVEFDTPHTLFRLPPLTLQPIVENAVKHGIDPELEPLSITVQTRQTDKGSEIIVKDTGPGFAPADDDSPHIALENIRKRLDMMCGGTLTISSGEESGTTVKIFIPEK